MTRLNHNFFIHGQSLHTYDLPRAVKDCLPPSCLPFKSTAGLHSRRSRTPLLHHLPPTPFQLRSEPHEPPLSGAAVPAVLTALLPLL